MNSLVASILLLVCVVSFGDVNEVVDSSEWLKSAFAFFTSLKGLSTVAIVAGAVQVVMMFFKTRLADFAGKWRLRIVIILTAIGMLASGLANGENLLALLVSAPFIALIQVGIYEFTKEEVLKPVALRKAAKEAGQA